MHTVLYDRVHDIPQYNISIDITLLYVLKYNIVYCSLQILNDWSVGKEFILLPKKESRNWHSRETKLVSRVKSFAILAREEELHFYVWKFTKANSAGGQHSRVTMQKNCIYKPNCVSFHFKIVNSLLRSCFLVLGSLY